MADRTTEFQALVRVAHMSGVEVRVLYEWVQEDVVRPPESGWNDEAVEAVQRIRRLSELGLNAEGIEVALHMREELIALRAELAALERALSELQRRHEVELARLIRELAADADWST